MGWLRGTARTLPRKERPPCPHCEGERPGGDCDHIGDVHCGAQNCKGWGDSTGSSDQEDPREAGLPRGRSRGELDEDTSSRWWSRNQDREDDIQRMRAADDDEDGVDDGVFSRNREGRR